MSLLTIPQRIEAFKLATRGFERQLAENDCPAMTDAEIEALLAMWLGIFGGTSGDNDLCVIYKGTGLKIWAGFGCVNYYRGQPIFKGNATIRAAREIYQIPDPANQQLALFA